MQVLDINAAIGNVVKDLGSDILKSATLVGVLSDYHAFNIHDPLLSEKKSAISALAVSGYVDELLKWKKQSGNLWQSEDAQWIEELCKKQGLKRNIVGIIADAMKSAIGIEVTFTEVSDPKKMLSVEMHNYESALRRLVSTDIDSLGIKFAYFSTSANTELYRLEGRLKILSQTTNNNSPDINDWIKKTKRQLLENNSTPEDLRHSIAQKALSSDGIAYAEILKEQTKLGKKGKDYFVDQSQLKMLADRINRAYEMIGDKQMVDVNNDIDNAKRNIKKYRRKRFFWIVSAAVLTLVLGTFFIIDRINHSKYSTEIEAFKKTIEAGDKALAEGNTVDALGFYSKAKDDYTVVYKHVRYISIADSKLEKASKQIISEYRNVINQLLSTGNYRSAKEKYEELSMINNVGGLDDYFCEFDSTLTAAIKEGRDSLLISISNNKGKFSQKQREEIDSMLYCRPNDYYLNMIKTKMK